jgi:glycosyltransferase involved in cell wall biosynthesis
MLTLLYITSRGLYPLTRGPLGQYDLLAESLAAQTDDAGHPFIDYEVVIVDRDNPLPRREVAHACRHTLGGVRCLRPRATPWTRQGAFAPNAARNTGLVYARGDVVVGLDDCYELSPRALWRTAQLAVAGLYPAAVLSQTDASVAYGPQPLGPLGAEEIIGGICAYPRAVADELNGWDERFDGASGGDVDFTLRLRLAGVRFVRHEDVAVVGHDHGARTAPHPRCLHIVGALAAARRTAERLRANEPWTPAELVAFDPRVCGRLDRECQYTGFECKYPDPDEPAAARENRVQYESHPWFDLAAARRDNALE